MYVLRLHFVQYLAWCQASQIVWHTDKNAVIHFTLQYANRQQSRLNNTKLLIFSQHVTITHQDYLTSTITIKTSQLENTTGSRIGNKKVELDQRKPVRNMKGRSPAVLYYWKL